MTKSYNSVYYKEVPVVTGDMDETLIVTYSPKYKAYQRKVRNRQIERAQKIISATRFINVKVKIRMILCDLSKRLRLHQMVKLPQNRFMIWMKI